MPNGMQCRGYALLDGDLCYFHSRQLIAAQKPVTSMDSIEIPLLEDRCAIQVTITQVLRAVVNKTIDRPRASLLLYGLQLSLQSVEHFPCSIPMGTVTDLSKTYDGLDLAADPDEDEDEDEDSDESESDNDEDSEDDSEEDDGEADEEEDYGTGEEDIDEILDSKTIGELITSGKYLQTAARAMEVGDTRMAACLVKKSETEPILRLTLTQRQAALLSKEL